MGLSTAVCAGNSIIADFARSSCPNVGVVPTTIDVDGAYARRKQHAPGAELVVGWSGSRTTAQYLEAVLPVLARVAEQVPMRLLVIGAEVDHPGLRIECRPWRSDTEVDDLLDMDVGLMPLVDDEWTRGKCGLKALQYMALGIPCILSPVGVNAEIVTDAENGYWVRTEDDWHRSLDALTDPELRERMGAAARLTVRERYSARVGAEKLAALLRQAVPQRGRTARTSAA
jgi:glycosyltransferase involved in cell wall biosynthesis